MLDSTKIVDTTNIAKIAWNEFFTDSTLTALIDTAVHNNLDLMMTAQEIEIAKSKIQLTGGKLFPTVSAGMATSIEKVGRYTSQGAGDASADITPGEGVPESLTNFQFGFQTSWEADIWGKLHAANKSALQRYLSSVEGRNFLLTNLIAEVAGLPPVPEGVSAISSARRR